MGEPWNRDPDQYTMTVKPFHLSTWFKWWRKVREIQMYLQLEPKKVEAYSLWTSKIRRRVGSWEVPGAVWPTWCCRAFWEYFVEHFGRGRWSAMGTSPATGPEVLLQKGSVWWSAAVVLPVGMKNLEDCSIHPEAASVGALRSDGRPERSLLWCPCQTLHFGSFLYTDSSPLPQESLCLSFSWWIHARLA